MKLLHYSNSNEQIQNIIPGTQWLLAMYDGLYLYPENADHNAFYGLDRKYIHIFNVDENSENILLSNASPEKIDLLIEKIFKAFPELNIEILPHADRKHDTKFLINNVIPRSAKKLKITKEQILINTLGINAVIDVSNETKCVSMDNKQDSVEAVFLTMDNLELIEITENK